MVIMFWIKVIIIGFIFLFVDLIFNFDEVDIFLILVVQDMWFVQFKVVGCGKFLMFGDDIWFKLFFEMFDCEDGIMSFFVVVSCLFFGF